MAVMCSIQLCNGSCYIVPLKHFPQSSLQSMMDAKVCQEKVLRKGYPDDSDDTSQPICEFPVSFPETWDLKLTNLLKYIIRISLMSPFFGRAKTLADWDWHSLQRLETYQAMLWLIFKTISEVALGRSQAWGEKYFLETAQNLIGEILKEFMFAAMSCYCVHIYTVLCYTHYSYLIEEVL